MVLSERVASDGNVTVKLIDSDLDRGLFCRFGVTEEYELSIWWKGNRKRLFTDEKNVIPLI